MGGAASVVKENIWFAIAIILLLDSLLDLGLEQLTGQHLAFDHH
jgi:hypothetical protein